MLTPEQIDLAIQQHVDPVATYGRLHNFARAIEAEVRKRDDALIRQLVEALEDFDDAGPLGEGWKSDRLLSLLASARAWLEGKP